MTDEQTDDVPAPPPPPPNSGTHYGDRPDLDRPRPIMWPLAVSLVLAAIGAGLAVWALTQGDDAAEQRADDLTAATTSDTLGSDRTSDAEDYIADFRYEVPFAAMMTDAEILEGADVMCDQFDAFGVEDTAVTAILELSEQRAGDDVWMAMGITMRLAATYYCPEHLSEVQRVGAVLAAGAD